MKEDRKNLPKLDLDFNKPEDARRFLRGFRMPSGQPIMYVETVGGLKVVLDEATDEQAMQFADEIFSTLYSAPDSRCSFEEELLH
jgi:hypothetical protein